MQPETPAPASPQEATPIGPARAFVVRSPRKTWAVPLLLVLNSGVFAAMVLTGGSWNDPSLLELLRAGANHGPYVAQGDWWRLVSCAFVHIGFVHFMVNMASLFALRIAESFYGSGAYLLLYLMSAIGGSACSVLWHPGSVSAGASGAVFGVAGALVAFFVAHRHSIPELLLRPVLRNLLVLIALNLFYGAMVPGVDNMAHVGGLATGLIAGRALDRDPQGSARLDLRRLARAGVPAILLGLLCLLIPWRAASAADIRQEIASDQAHRELGLGHVDEALRIAEEGLARDATDPDLLDVRARVRILHSDPNAALSDLNELLYQRPDDSQARILRARVLQLSGRFEEALEDAEHLVRQNPDDPRFRQLAGELYWCFGRWRESAVEFGVLARRRGESAIEGQLYLFLARCRMGEEDQALRELRHYLAMPRFSRDSTLDINIGGLFAGQTTLDALLAEFDRRGTPGADLARLYFFVALWRDLRGDPAQARAFLRKAVEGPASQDSTWLLARFELARFEKR